MAVDLTAAGSRPTVSWRFGLVTEYMLGHVMLTRLLREAAGSDASIEADFFPLSYFPRGAVESLPGLRSNWSLAPGAC